MEPVRFPSYRRVCGAALALAAVLAVPSYGQTTQIWSQPDTTKVWSDPGTTETWSAPSTTQPWSAPGTTEVWSEPVTTEQVDPEKMEREEVVREPGPFDARLVGAWDLRVEGGIWYSSDGLSIYQHYTPGADMNRLRIEPDGRYRWGERQGRLVQVQPWYAQEGARYYRLTAPGGREYVATFDALDGSLRVVCSGVGGCGATGTRTGSAPERLDPRLVGEWTFPALSLMRNRLKVAADGSYEWGSTDPMYSAARGQLTPGLPVWGTPGVRYYGGLGGILDPYFVAFVDGSVTLFTEAGKVYGVATR